MPPPHLEVGSLRVEVFQEQAADVGGDFYAYHEVGEGLLLLAVGDASGKGIPAALESARVCTLISLKAPSCSAAGLAEWLADLNDVIRLTAEKAGTLTTLAVLLIDRGQRRVYACSFGQFRPRYFSAANRWEELECPVYPPLGLSTAGSFPTICVSLALGREWLLLTDGFVEARDVKGSQFGESALQEALSACGDDRSELLAILEDRWRKFSDPSTERDDATAMHVADASPRPLTRYACEISPETIPDLRYFCEQWTENAGFSEEAAYPLILALDEILTNVYRHAYHESTGGVECTASVDVDALNFLVIHFGDGLSSADVVKQSRDPSRLGGYGLPFIHKTFDDVVFTRDAGCSKIWLSKKLRF
jgi:anti-sigma regulatory factor (Ser/Thr protein kinase)